MKWLYLFAFWLICSLVGSQTASAQLFQSKTMSRDSDLRVSVGMGIGTRGIQTTTNFGLADQDGVMYDLYNISLQPGVKSALNLSRDQSREIAEIYEKVRSELAKSTTSVLSDNSIREEMELTYREALKEMKTVLTEKQIELLGPVTQQYKIQQKGMEKFVRSVADSNGISVSDSALKSISKSKIGEARKRIESELVVEANKKLLGRLSSEQQEQVEQAMKLAKCRASYLKMPLYTGPIKRRQLKRPDRLLQLVIHRYLRDKCEISEDQLVELKNAKDELKSVADRETALLDVLDENQQTKLAMAFTVRQAKRFGTAISLTGGELGEFLTLSGQEEKELFEFATTLARELEHETGRRLQEHVSNSLQPLPKKLRVAVLDQIGEICLPLR